MAMAASLLPPPLEQPLASNYINVVFQGNLVELRLFKNSVWKGTTFIPSTETYETAEPRRKLGLFIGNAGFVVTETLLGVIRSKIPQTVYYP